MSLFIILFWLSPALGTDRLNFIPCIIKPIPHKWFDYSSDIKGEGRRSRLFYRGQHIIYFCLFLIIKLQYEYSIMTKF